MDTCTVATTAVRAYAEEHFSKERMARNYKAQYTKVLNEARFGARNFLRAENGIKR